MENIYILLLCSVFLIMLYFVITDWSKEKKDSRKNVQIKTNKDRVAETFRFVKNFQEFKVQKDTELLRFKDIKSSDFVKSGDEISIETNKVPEIILEKMVIDKVTQEKQTDLKNFFNILAANYEEKLKSADNDK